MDLKCVAINGAAIVLGAYAGYKLVPKHKQVGAVAGAASGFALASFALGCKPWVQDAVAPTPVPAQPDMPNTTQPIQAGQMLQFSQQPSPQSIAPQLVAQQAPQTHVMPLQVPSSIPLTYNNLKVSVAPKLSAVMPKALIPSIVSFAAKLVPAKVKLAETKPAGTVPVVDLSALTSRLKAAAKRLSPAPLTSSLPGKTPAPVLSWAAATRTVTQPPGSDSFPIEKPSVTTSSSAAVQPDSSGVFRLIASTASRVTSPITSGAAIPGATNLPSAAAAAQSAAQTMGW